jgi:hypothetical protein
MTRDPIGESSDINLYRANNNSSANWVDPTGLVVLVTGSPSFQKSTSSELNKLRSKPNGKALYDSLNKSKNIHKIVESTAGNSCDPDKGYSPGKKTGSTVYFNPNNWVGGVDVTGSNIRPPFVGLGHEMGHSEAVDNGTQTFNPGTGAPGTTPPREQNSLRRENQIRRENNLPIRPSYY